jgi:hypothetical protein
MYRKFSIGLVIFISAFMLNVSAMAFQQRYDRKEEDKEHDPFVIEMADQQVFKFLKNIYFFDLPLKDFDKELKIYFINDELGFGNQYEGSFNLFNTCQLKFLLINYIGFYTKERTEGTYYYQPKSGQ